MCLHFPGAWLQAENFLTRQACPERSRRISIPTPRPPSNDIRNTHPRIYASTHPPSSTEQLTTNNYFLRDTLHASRDTKILPPRFTYSFFSFLPKKCESFLISCHFFSFFHHFSHFFITFYLPILPNPYNPNNQPPFFTQKQTSPSKKPQKTPIFTKNQENFGKKACKNCFRVYNDNYKESLFSSYNVLVSVRRRRFS